MMMDKIAIVILNWNGAKMLKAYLPSVLKYSPEATVYVADNASTDESVSLLRTHFPECRLILLDKNWGFADGYNKALAQVEAEYYLLLNSDIEVTPHWLEPMIALMDTHQEVAACQPKLLSVFNRDSFEYAGACGGFLDRLGYPYCRGRVFDSVEADRGQYDSAAEIHWATGAALLVRACDYNKVGGLDGRFFAHSEEIDFCWRLRIMGRKICCVAGSKVYHVGGGTLPKANPMKTYLNFRNNLTMLYKCLPDDQLNRVMRLRWLLDYVAAFKMLLVDRNRADFQAVCRARRDFKAWRRQFEVDRQRIQLHRQSTAELSRFSLLWQYYLCGRKVFSDLPQTLHNFL